MPGPHPKYAIQLLDNDITALQQLVNSRKTPQCQARRAKIILVAQAHPDWTNQAIASQVGSSDRIVRKWRRRWCQTQSLEDLPRPGAPKRFSPGGESASHGSGL